MWKGYIVQCSAALGKVGKGNPTAVRSVALITGVSYNILSMMVSEIVFATQERIQHVQQL